MIMRHDIDSRYCTMILLIDNDTQLHEHTPEADVMFVALLAGLLLVCLGPAEAVAAWVWPAVM
jgi:hypothetical protein